MNLVALEKPLKVRLLRFLKPRTAKISVRKLKVPIKLDELLILSSEDFHLKNKYHLLPFIYQRKKIFNPKWATVETSE